MYKLNLLINAIMGAEFSCEVVSCILQNDFLEKKEDCKMFDKKDYKRLKENIESLKNDIADIKKIFN